MEDDRSEQEIEYYSDVLCVWALIAEIKNAELKRRFHDRVRLRQRYLDLFCDTETRIGKGWKERGGYAAFGDHVRSVAGRYLEETVHPRIWNDVRPSTSANAHLYLKATSLALGPEAEAQGCRAMRRAFFFEGRDIARAQIVLDVLGEQGIRAEALVPFIEGGQALSALLADSRLSQEARVSGSPTWRLNEGRQLLYGNIGYRVLSANIEELLKHPENEASWC